LSGCVLQNQQLRLGQTDPLQGVANLTGTDVLRNITDAQSSFATK
jgi:hypothetical protein